MGELLEFRQRPRRGRVAPENGREAQILFFTGVRYERHVEEPEPQTPERCGNKEGSKRRRKRASA